MKGIEVNTHLNSLFFFQGFTALHHAAQLPTKTMANLLILFGTDKNRVARVSEMKCFLLFRFLSYNSSLLIFLIYLLLKTRFCILQNGHTAQSIAKQLGRPAILGALRRSSQLENDKPLTSP